MEGFGFTGSEDMKNIFSKFMKDAVGIDCDQRSPKLDIINNPENIHIVVDLPGMEMDEVSIALFNNELTISGERKRYFSNVIQSELSYGPFRRVITLPIAVTQKESVSKNFYNGVLTISIDKRNEEQNRFNI